MTNRFNRDLPPTASILAITLLGLLGQCSLAGQQDGRLDIYWVDVEGGAATLVVTPAGESILVDAGNPGLRDPNRIANAVARVAGLRRIDHLIVTHYHRDHFGGAATLAKLVPIGTVYDNGTFENMPNDPGKEYFAFKCDQRTTINPGSTLPVKQGAGAKLKVHCLGTRKQFVAANGSLSGNEQICASARDKKRDGSDNANSVVTLFEFGAFRFYDAGDLTWNQEKRLVCPKNLVGKVDVYQVTHHGLDSSNNPLVLRTIKPTVAIMNNGKRKGCAPEVFANLQETKSLRAVYQLHRNERPDGKVNNVAMDFIANRNAKETGNMIKLSVAADGTSYEVTIPAYNHKATYSTTKK